MNIGVLVKPVPDPEQYNSITIDPETKRLNRSGVPTIVNPSDKCAVEAALKLKEKFGGKIVIFTMAPPDGREKLMEVLAMGADEAVLVSDREFGGADTLATSYTLVKAVEKKSAESESFDLILSGNESADGATGHVPAQVGEMLGFNHLSAIVQIVAEGEGRPDSLTVFQKIENGKNEFEIKLPAVIGVTRDINKPRYTSAMGVIKAKKKPFDTYDCEALSPDKSRIGIEGSPTKAGAIFTPDTGRKSEELSGSPEEIAEELVKRIKAIGVTINSGGGCRE
ncbi:MAG: electron transfer flavoprotein subunit beta/FixA family protein [Spirochaetales bacterium]|uniref:Electron transfer flavoprotein subunit beta/FixA family protein n=1 Tax=Candidatus Thalassospirochaeta sargassi TaxID=3119039 RepID=A0AAJ1MMQ2_9SPIO|nr:electron transfer flavoprotein subunit beta/FixA family protein [Spirochaetales bacterium]